jgi:hypothetical protein
MHQMNNRVQIAKGVFMYPVFEIPVDLVCDITTGRNGLENAVLNQEVEEWLFDQGLDPSDHLGSHIWTYYFIIEDHTATFMFADPQIAMLFKLRYQGVF